MPIQAEPWGEVEGQPVHKITVCNKSGSLKMSVITYGAAIQSFAMKRSSESEGMLISFTTELVEVQLGLDTLQDYVNSGESGCSYFGATIGRFGNRIKEGVYHHTLHYTTLH